MVFTFKDLKQSSAGAFMATVIFLALRGGSVFTFDPTKGLIISVILVFIYYNGFQMKDKLQHFLINTIVAFSVSALLANTFGLIEYSDILSYNVFGTTVIIATWIGLISAMVYDRYNFTSPMKRMFVKK